MADIFISDEEREREKRERRRAYLAEYRKRPEAKAAKKASYWKPENRAKKRAHDRKRYKDTREARLAYMREYIQRDSVRKARRAYLSVYSAANKAAILAYAAEYRKTDRSKASVTTAKAKRRKAVGSHTGEDIARIRRDQKDKCAYCRRPLNGKGEIDHILAIALGGTNCADNIQLTCRPCNRKKRTKDPVDFAQELGLLI